MKQAGMRWHAEGLVHDSVTVTNLLAYDVAGIIGTLQRVWRFAGC